MNYIRRPSVDLYPGIRVEKDTVLKYTSETVEQTLEDLVLHTVAHVRGEGYESTYDTTVYLKEGDILLYEDGGRGYIKPVESFVSIREAIEDLESILSLGGEGNV